MLYRIQLNNVTAGVVVVDGVIIESAPIFKKFIGAQFKKFEMWVERNGGYVELVIVR